MVSVIKIFLISITGPFGYLKSKNNLGFRLSSLVLLLLGLFYALGFISLEAILLFMVYIYLPLNATMVYFTIKPNITLQNQSDIIYNGIQNYFLTLLFTFLIIAGSSIIVQNNILQNNFLIQVVLLLLMLFVVLFLDFSPRSSFKDDNEKILQQ